VVGDLEATLREALANVARHAGAGHLDVRVTVRDGDLVLSVADDGVGPPPAGHPRGRGLDNMTERAARHGGTFELRAGPAGGSEALWRVPIG
jgi:signal transduction histidine kinase